MPAVPPSVTAGEASIDLSTSGQGAPPPSPIGAMVLLSTQAEAFSEHEAYLVTLLAAQLAPALAHAGLAHGTITGSLQDSAQGPR